MLCWPLLSSESLDWKEHGNQQDPKHPLTIANHRKAHKWSVVAGSIYALSARMLLKVFWSWRSPASDSQIFSASAWADYKFMRWPGHVRALSEGPSSLQGRIRAINAFCQGLSLQDQEGQQEIALRKCHVLISLHVANWWVQTIGSTAPRKIWDCLLQLHFKSRQLYSSHFSCWL